MVGPGNEFDDGLEEEPASPLLPPEDRLWRHPSEIAAHGRSLSEEALNARSRWLSSTPTRAGAWSAGVIGAVLATGVVLVGTHLTTWIDHGSAPAKPALAVDLPMVATSTTLASIVAPKLESRTGVEAIGRKVADGLALVEGWTATEAHVVADGIVISANGMIAVPASVAGYTGLQVTVSGGQFPAQLLGVDPMSQVAVLHIGTSGLTPMPLDTPVAMSAGQWMGVEWLDRAAIVVSVGAIQSLVTRTEPESGMPALYTRLKATASGMSSQPCGAVVIDYSGRVSGLVTYWRAGQLYEIPGPTLKRIADELIETGHVVHGWLGIEGKHVAIAAAQGGENTFPGKASKLRLRAVSGVEVTAVDPASAAALSGIRKGDVLQFVDGMNVTTVSQLQAVLYFMPPGERVRVVVDRRGRELHKTLELKAVA